MKQRCKTCRHFESLGRARGPGRCRWPWPTFAVPEVITNAEPRRIAAWPMDGKTCPTWEPVE
jgi:hypothetical protein